MKILTNTGILPMIDGAYTLDMGHIKKDTDTTTELSYIGDDLSEFHQISTCGCSTGGIKQSNKNQWDGWVKYKDSHILGSFSKIFRMEYTEAGKQKNEKLRIKGEIIL